MDVISKPFQNYGIFQPKLAIDEVIVRYYSHKNLKEFISGKPVRFGYKLWAMLGSDGNCHKFDPCLGKEGPPELHDQPMDMMVVLDMLILAATKCFFSNFFTSKSLLSWLKERGFVRQITFREN